MDTPSLSPSETETFINSKWESEIIPELCAYIEIPNQSPGFDSEWATNGLMDQAVDLIVGWIKTQEVAGMTLDVIREEGRTPLIFMEIESNCASSSTVMMYGHMDKQPPMTEFWDEGLGPWTPVIKDGKLYGRGGADDGYAAYAAVTAVKALQLQGVPHSRIVIIIEACEESGSRDLPFYVDKLKARIGTPSLVVCLDSGAGNYEQLWVTTSLRGGITGNLVVKLLSEGVHSGNASGIIPSTFRIARQLLDRIEDAQTGRVKGAPFHCHIPAARYAEAEQVVKVIGDMAQLFPLLPGCKPVDTYGDWVDTVLNRSWRPALSITGAAGMPSLEAAGNVLRPMTALKLSLRVPPLVQAKQASDALKAILEQDPPYGAHVEFQQEKAGQGWHAPLQTPWLTQAVMSASQQYYGKPACYQGEGGSIPFMGMLGGKFPEAQFLIIGVLGPQSNAHGPNEFLHLQFAKRLTCCVSSVLAAQWRAAAAAAAADDTAADGTAAAAADDTAAPATAASEGEEGETAFLRL